MSTDPTNSLDALVRRAIDAFEDHFDRPPEVGARAPGRVNLIGEHTDYNDGFVLPMAIDRWTVIVGRRNDSRECRTVAADLDGETATFANDASLEPGEPRWANYVKGVIAQAAAKGHPTPSFDAVVVSSVPIGAGLSSSAALEVATMTLVETMREVRIDPIEKAAWCREAEREFVGVPCGIMDQMVSVLGRAGHALRIDCRDHAVRPVKLDDPNVTVLLTDSKVQHDLADGAYAERRRACERAVAVLRDHLPNVRALRDVSLDDVEAVRERMGDIVFRRARHVVLENRRVERAADAMDRADYEAAGALMYESHRSLRDDYQVSTPELDLLVDLTKGWEGVYGSRMTGGGFGGCTVTLVRTDAAAGLADHLRRVYRKETGREAACFSVAASEGAGEIAF